MAVSCAGGKFVGKRIGSYIEKYDAARKPNMRGISRADRRIAGFWSYAHTTAAADVTSYYVGGGYKSHASWW
jgi:hypothetical protein